MSSEAEFAVMLECLEHECRESGELERCIQIIQLNRKRLLRKIVKNIWS